jgi:hypothetical protein
MRGARIRHAMPAGCRPAPCVPNRAPLGSGGASNPFEDEIAAPRSPHRPIGMIDRSRPAPGRRRCYRARRS